MPNPALWPLLLIVALAICFGLTNGFNDAANAIATVIGTRVLSPRNAVILAAICNFTGAATGLEVARTIGKGILIPEAISYLTVIAALTAVISWTAFATYKGLPVSLTHGFVAALAAAGTAAVGSDAVIWSILQRVMAAVVTAPVLGFIGGFALMVALYWIFRRTRPEQVRSIFSKLQIVSSAFMAYTHGKNDGQMPIGVIAMALVIYYNKISQPAVADTVWQEIQFGSFWWVIVISALAISVGMAIGGWRVIKTLGMRVTTLRPVHGFAAQTAAAIVIEWASWWGIPVSTTHCISTSIMGVGATRRLSAVRWGIAGNIIAAWVITFPVCGGLGYLFAQLLMLIM